MSLNRLGILVRSLKELGCSGCCNLIMTNRSALLGQSFISFTLLEIVNYVEHYGLNRKKLSNGRYEKVLPVHSWNANHKISNLLLFKLQRHSDHHANALRRYQILRNFEEAPQLPFGYPIMVLMALFPPLWKAVMNPKVDKHLGSLPDSSIS